MPASRRVVATIGSAADRIDARRRRRGRSPHGPGGIATVWASVKVLASLPAAGPAMALIAWRAMVNHLAAKATMAQLPDLIDDIAAHRAVEHSFGDVVRIDAATPLVVTSDLHRCVAGRLDLAGAQDDRDLYAAMLDWYGDRDHTLVENGDVEDFWMVGGSTWGTAYDVLRLVGALLVGRLGDGLRQSTYRAHLDRIVANNRVIYGRIATRFAADGRYLRTIGNHDDVYLDPRLGDALAAHTGPHRMSSWIALDGPDGLEAVITHGHVADGWNAPRRSTLGKVSSWLADMLRDAPIPITPDDLSPPRRTRELLVGRRRNGLLRVSPRFGASSSYDSLDEELLFDALGGASDVGPWILMGHTHFPVLQPASDTGARWWRYANSGHGLGAGVVTALEWPGGPHAAERSPRLVAWLWADHPDWVDLVGRLAPTTRWDDRPVLRVELLPSADGRTLLPLLHDVPLTAPAG